MDGDGLSIGPVRGGFQDLVRKTRALPDPTAAARDRGTVPGRRGAAAAERAVHRNQTGQTLSRRAAALLGLAALLVGPLARGQAPATPPPPTLPGSFTRQELTVGGVARSYFLYAPARRVRRPAVLFVLHGAGSNAERARLGMAFEFDKLAERDGFLLVYGNGLGGYWNDCKTGLPDQTDKDHTDDFAYLTAIRDTLVATRNADRKRVYVAGMSNGGELVYRLAQEHPTAFRGFAAVLASLPVDDPLRNECQPSGRAVPLLVLNATKDPINPWAGGEVNIFKTQPRGSVLSGRATADYFAGLAGYRGEPRRTEYPDIRTTDKSTAYRLDWRGFGKPPVTLVVIEGGGHAFPQPTTTFPPFFGATNGDINAAAVIWQFFSGR